MYCVKLAKPWYTRIIKNRLLISALSISKPFNWRLAVVRHLKELVFSFSSSHFRSFSNTRFPKKVFLGEIKAIPWRIIKIMRWWFCQTDAPGFNLNWKKSVRRKLHARIILLVSVWVWVWVGGIESVREWEKGKLRACAWDGERVRERECLCVSVCVCVECQGMRKRERKRER